MLISGPSWGRGRGRYPATVGNYPSYFTAIAVTDGTTVNFTVP
ncbi:hypothetical protein PPSIR1_26101, partial [Plesiocystis pacifica SIR-1]